MIHISMKTRKRKREPTKNIRRKAFIPIFSLIRMLSRNLNFNVFSISTPIFFFNFLRWNHFSSSVSQIFVNRFSDTETNWFFVRQPLRIFSCPSRIFSLSLSLFLSISLPLLSIQLSLLPSSAYFSSAASLFCEASFRCFFMIPLLGPFSSIGTGSKSCIYFDVLRLLFHAIWI